MGSLLVCNHKMFLTKDEAINLRNQFKDIDVTGIKLIVCPSYLNLSVFKDFNLGAQDAYYEDKGPYTAEISAYQLSLEGVRYCLVGHSDRKNIDTEKVINLKIKAMLRNSITPIYCIGETKYEKVLMKTSEVLKKQILSGLKDINLGKEEEIIIAYEPIWAVGTGKNIDKKELEDTVLFIRKILKSINIQNFKILYGGSVNSKTIKEISDVQLDGYLVGSNSVLFDELKEIIKCIK